MPLTDKKRRADHIIDNTGSREQVERQARELFADLKRKAATKECGGCP
jgi:dephospho-CoA kinase